MAHDVFISHSVKDKATADAVCAMLESQGVRCWIAPRDVMPGMEWGECIIEAIEQTRVMVLVFTADANASAQIRREIERAVNHGVAILPVRIENVMPGRALEYFIGNVHWLDALTPPLEAHLKNLAGTVKMLLARLDQPPPPMPHAVAGGVLQASKPPELTVAQPAESAFAPPPEPSAAKRAEPAPTPSAEPVAVPPEKPRPAEIFPAKAATEDAMFTAPAKVSPSADSDRGKPNTRKLGEQQPIFAAVPSAPPRKIPVWAWVGGAAAILLIAVFAAVHFNSNSAPVASPESVTPPVQSAPGPAGPGGAAQPPEVSPQPAADNAALLRATMGTLENELSSTGTVSFSVLTQNKADGRTSQVTHVQQASNVVADPAQCRVSYHWKVLHNGAVTWDKDGGFLLRDVTAVVVEPESQHKTELDAKGGRPNLVTISTTPAVTALLVRGPSGPVNQFPFTDADLADRTAATLKQAVKLCGGTLTN
jgi:hypothetical protein